METNESQKTYLKIGYYSSFILSILTITVFGFAMTAIPPAGGKNGQIDHPTPI